LCYVFQFNEDEFQLRDPETHDYHCSLLDGPLSAEDSTTYGVNVPCPLNSINHFHVAHSQIPQDIMHVIIEGVLPMETKLMLNAFMDDGFLTIEMLNERVSNFVYGRDEARNKPPKPFQKTQGLVQSFTCHVRYSFCMQRLKSNWYLLFIASQMWNFATLLPLMIGDRIPDDNSKWECFLLLLEIIKMCTAKVTSTKESDYVKILIEQHHALFKICYPGVSFTPKMHYMVHFPRLLT
jgi:hypothetical protein